MSQQQIEFACKDIIFHFNKKHLEDQTIPMWVLKFHGETYYVNHVDCEIPWSTKETPNNSHTKGSIKVKDCLLTIDPENNATIKTLTFLDKVRLRNQKLRITRIMTESGSALHKALQKNEYKHSPFKNIGGACSTPFVICDLLNESDITLIMLKFGSLRVLKPNEGYYQAYDDKGKHIPVDYGDRSTPYEYS